MAIAITMMQQRAYELIKSNPNTDRIKLTVLMGQSKHSVSRVLESLMKKEVIVRKKGALVFEYTVIDVEYEVKAEIKQRSDNKKVDEIEIPADDELLHGAMAFEFSKEQIKFIRENKGMPRTLLANKLGISKLEMNVALDRLKKKN